MADDIPSRSHMMMMSRSDLQGVRREPRVARAGNQFYGALIPMFLAHDHHDEKDPYLVAPELKLRGHTCGVCTCDDKILILVRYSGKASECEDMSLFVLKLLMAKLRQRFL